MGLSNSPVLPPSVLRSCFFFIFAVLALRPCNAVAVLFWFGFIKQSQQRSTEKGVDQIDASVWEGRLWRLTLQVVSSLVVVFMLRWLVFSGTRRHSLQRTSCMCSWVCLPCQSRSSLGTGRDLGFSRHCQHFRVTQVSEWPRSSSLFCVFWLEFLQKSFTIPVHLSTSQPGSQCCLGPWAFLKTALSICREPEVLYPWLWGILSVIPSAFLGDDLFFLQISKDERGLKEREDQSGNSTPQSFRSSSSIQEIVIKVPRLCFSDEDDRLWLIRKIASGRRVGTVCHQVGLQWLVPPLLFSPPCRAVLPSLPLFLVPPASSQSHCAAWRPSSFQGSLPSCLTEGRKHCLPSVVTLLTHSSPPAEVFPPNPVSLCMNACPSCRLQRWLHTFRTSYLERGGWNNHNISCLFVSGSSARNTRRHWNVY